MTYDLGEKGGGGWKNCERSLTWEKMWLTRENCVFLVYVNKIPKMYFQPSALGCYKFLWDRRTGPLYDQRAIICVNTYKWSRSSVRPLAVKRGGPYGPNIGNILLRTNIALKFGSLVKCSKKTKMQQKIKNRTCKWQPINHLRFHNINFSTKNGKTIFP